MKITISKKKDIIKIKAPLVSYQYEKLFGISTERTLKLKITRMKPELITEIKQMNEFISGSIKKL